MRTDYGAGREVYRQRKRATNTDWLTYSQSYKAERHHRTTVGKVSDLGRLGTFYCRKYTSEMCL